MSGKKTRIYLVLGIVLSFLFLVGVVYVYSKTQNKDIVVNKINNDSSKALSMMMETGANSGVYEEKLKNLNTYSFWPYTEEEDFEMMTKSREKIAFDDGTENGIKLGKEQGIKLGKEQGIKLGKEQGIKMGEERGIKMGEERGKKTASKDIAQKLLNMGLSIAEVSLSCGLSENEIVKLSKSLHPNMELIN